MLQVVHHMKQRVILPVPWSSRLQKIRSPCDRFEFRRLCCIHGMEDRTNGDGSLTPSQTFRDVNWNPETIYTMVMITVKSGKLKESKRREFQTQ